MPRDLTIYRLTLNDIIPLYFENDTSYSKKIRTVNALFDLSFVDDDTNKPTQQFLKCVSFHQASHNSLTVRTRYALYDKFIKSLPSFTLEKIFTDDNKLNRKLKKLPEVVLAIYNREKNKYPDTIINYMDKLLENKDYLSFSRWLLFLCCFCVDEDREPYNYLKFIGEKMPNHKHLEIDKHTDKVASKEVHLISKGLTNYSSVFKGRDELLLQIYDHFQNKGHFIFLQGTGGIGKSELAKQYAKKYKSNYDVIVFAECDESLISAVNDNNKFSFTDLFISEQSNETEQQFYERKLNQLIKLNDRILVILDNVDYFSEELESFLSVPFDVIITTRYNYSLDYSANTKFISEINNKQTLREIFSAYYGKNVNSDPFTDMLIDIFESHTMAIELMAKQMKASHLTPENMYEILINNNETELNETFRVLNYDTTQRNITSHMQRLFNIASLNEEEQYIMKCLSLLPLSGMDKGNFKKCCNLEDYSAINSLIERSWVRESDDCISIHSLIQETIKIVLKPDLIKCIDFVNEIMHEFSATKCYYGDYSLKNKIGKIAGYIYNFYPNPTKELYNFYEWLELIFYYCNHNHLAIEIAERLLEIYIQNGENFRTARIIYKIGLISKHIGCIDKSIVLMEKSRNMLLKLTNKSDNEILYISDVDVALSNIFSKYKLLNDEHCKRIEELSNEIIQIRSNFKGDLNNRIDPVFTHLALPYLNLARIEIYHKNYDKLYEYLQKATTECEKLNLKFELHLIDTLKSKIAEENGNISSAIEYMNSAIQKYIEYFGENNIQINLLLNSLGLLYTKTDDIENATACYEKIRKNMDGADSFYKFYDDLKEKIESIIKKVEKI